MSQIRKHPFWGDMDWEAANTGKLKPPLMPEKGSWKTMNHYPNVEMRLNKTRKKPPLTITEQQFGMFLRFNTPNIYLAPGSEYDFGRSYNQLAHPEQSSLSLGLRDPGSVSSRSRSNSIVGGNVGDKLRRAGSNQASGSVTPVTQPGTRHARPLHLASGGSTPGGHPNKPGQSRAVSRAVSLCSTPNSHMSAGDSSDGNAPPVSFGHVQFSELVGSLVLEVFLSVFSHLFLLTPLRVLLVHARTQISRSSCNCKHLYSRRRRTAGDTPRRTTATRIIR
jgi:hypothetical protein